MPKDKVFINELEKAVESSWGNADKSYHLNYWYTRPEVPGGWGELKEYWTDEAPRDAILVPAQYPIDEQVNTPRRTEQQQIFVRDNYLKLMHNESAADCITRNGLVYQWREMERNDLDRIMWEWISDHNLEAAI